MTGDNYPASPEKLLIAQILQYVMYMFIAVVVFGEQIFASLGYERPEVLKTINENKLMYALGAFFIFA